MTTQELDQAKERRELVETGSTESIKRIGTGLSMILAPLLLAVGFAIHPAEKQSGAEQLQMIVDNIGRWNAAHLMILASLVLFIPATLGLMRRLRRGGAWFGLIGGALASIGVVFFGALVGVEALATSAFADVPADPRAGLAPGVQAFIDSKGLIPVVYLTAGLILGLLVLAAGLFVARTAPRWTSMTIAAASLVMLASLVVNDLTIGAVGAAVLLVGLGAVGLQTLRRTDEAWETTPAVSSDIEPARP